MSSPAARAVPVSSMPRNRLHYIRAFLPHCSLAHSEMLKYPPAQNWVTGRTEEEHSSLNSSCTLHEALELRLGLQKSWTGNYVVSVPAETEEHRGRANKASTRCIEMPGLAVLPQNCAGMTSDTSGFACSSEPIRFSLGCPCAIRNKSRRRREARETGLPDVTQGAQGSRWPISNLA